MLKAFAEGADGVLVSGCHPVDCHYIEGNHKMWARKVMLETMLQQLGIEPERFRLTWFPPTKASCSSSTSPRWWMLSRNWVRSEAGELDDRIVGA